MKGSLPKPFAFVLMPFNSNFKDVYELGIKQACLDKGFYCERVDEQHFEGTILERIYNQISKADVIISDMSTQNPNVFYETGYAHALGKKVILLTQNKNDIPFDMIHYPHIIYNNQITKLKDELSSKLDWIKHNEDKGNNEIILPTRYYHEKELLENKTIVCEINEKEEKFFSCFEINNYGNVTIHPEDFKVVISTGLQTDLSIFRLPDNTSYHEITVKDKIFPDGWISVYVFIYFDNLCGYGESERLEKFRLLEYSNYGKKVIEFCVKFVNKGPKEIL